MPGLKWNNTEPATERNRDAPLSATFLLCLFSFVMLLLNHVFGMVAIIGFLFPWILIFALKFETFKPALIQAWPLLLLPVLAGTSVLWSEDPQWTLKASAELALTVFIGILAASSVPYRTLIASIMCAFIMIAATCIFSLGDLSSVSGDAPLTGVFGSKNAFSAMMTILMLVSLCVFLDKTQFAFFRVTAFVALLITPALVYLGHSLGTITGVVLTMTIYALLRVLKFLSSPLRTLSLGLIGLLLSTVIILPTLSGVNPTAILVALGKDPTLTGRTYLWGHAIHNIIQRPLLGVGFGAFWRLQNPEAQEMWYTMHVAAGPGFNFHNEYFEILVEMGVFGFIILAFLLATMVGRAVSSAFSEFDPKKHFALIMLTFYLLRTPLEVGLIGQFDIGMIMFCILWIYLTPEANRKYVPLLKKTVSDSGIIFK